MVSSWLVWCDSKMILLLHQNDEKLWALVMWTFEATRRIPIHPFRVISCHKVFGFQKSLRCIFAFITYRDCWKIINRNQTEQFQMISNWSGWWRRQQVAGGDGEWFSLHSSRTIKIYSKNILFRFQYLTIWKQFGNHAEPSKYIFLC